MIIPERESPFEGWLESNRVKAQMKAKFPNFSKPYKPVYAEHYGLTEEMFNAFRQGFEITRKGSDRRVFVEALLSNYLALHSEMLAIEAALREADKEKSALVYRTGFRSFGFVPPAYGKNKEIEGPALPERKLTITQALELVTSKGDAFQESEEEEVQPTHYPAPQDLAQQVAQRYAPIVQINGADIACYIRSLVTAAAHVHHMIDNQEIENMVAAIGDHLAHVQLRTHRQMVDAGGLVAAEVRRVLQQLTDRFDLEVHVVMWDPSLGQITEFKVNTGTHAVWLFYTPGHFDLINR